MSGFEVRGLAGNLAQDVELRFSQQGRPWASLSIAVEHYVPPSETRPQREKEGPIFQRVKVFGQQAENLADIPKGTRLMVSGRLQESSWKDAQGQTRKELVVLADEVAISARWIKPTVPPRAPRSAGSYTERTAQPSADTPSDLGPPVLVPAGAAPLAEPDPWADNPFN